jgi:hypothetical protein
MKTPYVIKRMRLKDLKPHPDQKKVRFMSDEAKSGLAGSIEEFGMLEEIIVNRRTGHIVSGHQRCEILLGSGKKTAPVKVIDVDQKTEDAVFYTLNNHLICGEFTSETKGFLETLKIEEPELYKIVGLNLLESALPVNLTSFARPEDVSFKEFDESAENTVKKITCPFCGREFAA